MIIAQISDTHIALDTDDAARRVSDFERTIAHIHALKEKPDVIVHTGDIVQNGLREEYEKAAEILATSTLPVFLMVGNKDDRQQLRSAFPDHTYLKSKSNFVQYCIDEYPVRMIMLDTLHEGSNKGKFCSVRQAEFDQFAKGEPTKPRVVFAHHPPFLVPVGPEPLHFETKREMQEFQEILANTPDLLSVYCGHVHRGSAGHAGEVPIIVMPCIATSLRRGEYPKHMTHSPVYHVHKYEPQWGLTTEIQVVEN